MKKTLLIGLLLAGFIFPGFSSDKPAYKVFTTKGKSADFSDIVKSASSSDMIFFGELHDN